MDERLSSKEFRSPLSMDARLSPEKTRKKTLLQLKLNKRKSKPSYRDSLLLWRMARWFPWDLPNIPIIAISPSFICVKTSFHLANMLKIFQGMPILWSLSRTLEINWVWRIYYCKHLLRGGKTGVGVNRKVTQRPYGYLASELHPAGDNSRRVFSHLFTHEGSIRFYRRKVKI